MFRKLLTLLAVITGLTLSVAPVQASPARAVSVAQMAERVDCVLQGPGPLQLAETTSHRAATRLPCEHPAVIIHVPTIMLRIDRARE